MARTSTRGARSKSSSRSKRKNGTSKKRKTTKGKKTASNGSRSAPVTTNEVDDALSTLEYLTTDDTEVSSVSTVDSSPRSSGVSSATMVSKKNVVKEVVPFSPERDENMYRLGWLVALATYFSFAILIVVGRIRDLVGRLTGYSRFFNKSLSTGENANTAAIYVSKNPQTGETKRVKVAPLISLSDNFYLRRLYSRISDCWNRPITGYPSAGGMRVLERKSSDGHVTFDFSGKERALTNLGSYNYLGFADDWAESCKRQVENSLEDFGASRCSSLSDAGTTSVHRELESKVANFLGKEAALVMNMGYATNSNSIPAILGKGSLIVSDSCNHTSIVNGARASGAFIRVFRHDDVAHLEQVLRQSIVQGQPRTHRPWKKILVMVEGIYSMEGEISSLPAIVRVAKKI